MTAVPQMHQFVNDDVVHEAHRRLDDPPVQADGPGLVTTAPALLLVGQLDEWHRDAGLRMPRLDPFR